jgi:hypothetical protein
MGEHVPSGTLKTQCSEMSPQRLCIFESEAALLQHPTKVVEALVVRKRATALDEVADQMGEDIFIGHPRDGRHE